MLGSDRLGISGATPAPWDGTRGAATTAGWLPCLEVATKRTAQAAASQRVAAPRGIFFVGARPRAIQARPPRAFANLHPRGGQRAESSQAVRTPGKEASDGRCGASDERADAARRADGPVPSGAGGGLRITALASLERPPAFRRSAALSCSPGASRAAAP